MEHRTRKHAAPPERSRPPPPSPRHHHQQQQQQQQQARKIPVVYYLCRHRHLEHPHFIEVPVSSPDGSLYLSDVVNRLTVLRGKSMPAMYSWSCKRSYKSGFVWHDLSPDDLILPAHSNEYVLKGSELLDHHSPSTPDRSAGNPKLESLRSPPPEPPHQLREAANSGSSRDISPELTRPPSCETSSPGPSEYQACKPHGAADASTQTDDNGTMRRPRRSPGNRVRSISTDNDTSSPDLELDRNEISPEQELSSATSSSTAGKTETLESLIRAEASKMSSFRIIGEEEVFVPAAATKIKATDLLMQLITCGSISVKDHRGFGLVPTYLPRFSHVRLPSSVLSGSTMMGELDCLSENLRHVGLRMEDKEYYSGSLIETKKHKEDLGEVVPTLKRSSSYNADRNCNSPDSKKDKEKVVDSSRTKCLPRAIRMTPNKQSKSGTMRSPVSDCPRNSSAGLDLSFSSKGGSKNITGASSVNGSSMRLESFKEENERVIKIEERLASGARVIIQSRAPLDDTEGGFSS